MREKKNEIKKIFYDPHLIFFLWCRVVNYKMGLNKKPTITQQKKIKKQITLIKT